MILLDAAFTICFVDNIPLLKDLGFVATNSDPRVGAVPLTCL